MKNRPPPSPVLHSKQERPGYGVEMLNKKQLDKTASIAKDQTKDNVQASSTKTQSARMKEMQPQVSGNDRNSETGKLMVPTGTKSNASRSGSDQCKPEVKSTVPWYLQE